ncbi:hypothetical protein [Flaviaesturariibacter amylovorans]|uniref:Cobalt transporter n=1 Tax=Flaviaesturariibacter amylovorans TaxID=1084520 RepID=A0ABP8GCH6_9BACT
MRSRSSYWKALVLLLVLCAGTVLGAACALSASVHGWHHHGAAGTEEHRHANGVQHAHEHSGQHHDAPADDQNGSADCCSGKVAAFEKADKSPARTVEAPPVFFVPAPWPDHFSFTAPAPLLQRTTIPPFRWRPPATIPDLRIIIQSFQI